MGAFEGTRTTFTDHSYVGETATINQARLDLDSLLRANDLAAVADDARLILSELVSNAIEASPGKNYRVVAMVESDVVQITVSNPSTVALPAPDDWAPESVLAPQGRGLFIVNALSEMVTVEQSDGLTVVSARLRFDRG